MPKSNNNEDDPITRLLNDIQQDKADAQRNLEEIEEWKAWAAHLPPSRIMALGWEHDKPTEVELNHLESCRMCRRYFEFFRDHPEPLDEKDQDG